MKKIGLTFILIVSFSISLLASPGGATSDPDRFQAVYCGVVGYGTAAAKKVTDNGTTSAQRLDSLRNFTFRFYINGEERLYPVNSDNDFAINNTLCEGYVYDVTVVNGMVVTARLAEESAVGNIEKITADAIIINGKEIGITANTKVYRITSQAGGAIVAPTTLTAGETAKVYGNPAKAVYLTFVAEPYTPPLSYTPGQKTLKNILAAALQPVGTTLYVYGGGWEWQDEGVQMKGGSSSPQATNVGLPQTWIDFFQSQDKNYSYRIPGKLGDRNAQNTYYPLGNYNEYYYAGADCSGYIAWIVYNVANTESGLPGYVTFANQQARMLADLGFGTWEKAWDGNTIAPSEFKPGDIYSMNGHIWMCLGVCEDGSMVFLHSTPDRDNGNGCQISAMLPRGITSTDNAWQYEAVQLADSYMKKYYPAWSERYSIMTLCWSDYVTGNNDTASGVGKFSWGLGYGEYLSDPDGYLNMKPAEVLRDLFRENSSTPATDKPDEWALPAYIALEELGLLPQGISKSNAQENIRRDEFTALLTGLLDHTAPSMSASRTAHFTDTANSPYTSEINRAYEYLLIDGLSTEIFDPDGLLTREQAARLIGNAVAVLRGEHIDRNAIPDFSDHSQIATWASPFVAFAQTHDIIEGIGQGLFNPQGHLSQQMAVALIHRLQVNFGLEEGKFSITFVDNPTSKGQPLSFIRNEIFTAEQVLLCTVSSSNSSFGTAALYAHNSGGYAAIRANMPIRTGSRGVVPKEYRRQSTYTTPSGMLGILSAFGLDDDPGSLFPYYKIQEGDYWDLNSGSATYNRLIKYNPGGDYETLSKYTVPYKYALVTDYNYEQTPNKGGAIFVHCNGDGATAGCISFTNSDMEWLLKTLDPQKSPVIIIITEAELAEYCREVS